MSPLDEATRRELLAELARCEAGLLRALEAGALPSPALADVMRRREDAQRALAGLDAEGPGEGSLRHLSRAWPRRQRDAA